MNFIVVLTCFVLADLTFTQGKYLLVKLEKPKETLKQEGKPCGITAEEDCGKFNKGLICSNHLSPSPILPSTCGTCIRRDDNKKVLSQEVPLEIMSRGKGSCYSNPSIDMHGTFNPFHPEDSNLEFVLRCTLNPLKRNHVKWTIIPSGEIGTNHMEIKSMRTDYCVPEEPNCRCREMLHAAMRYEIATRLPVGSYVNFIMTNLDYTQMRQDNCECILGTLMEYGFQWVNLAIRDGSKPNCNNQQHIHAQGGYRDVCALYRANDCGNGPVILSKEPQD